MASDAPVAPWLADGTKFGRFPTLQPQHVGWTPRKMVTSGVKMAESPRHGLGEAWFMARGLWGVPKLLQVLGVLGKLLDALRNAGAVVIIAIAAFVQLDDG